jgi:LPXTG-site transpeptidase (sortase) family protein
VNRRSPIKVVSTILIIAGIGFILFPLGWIAYTSLRVGPAQAEALAGWERRVPEGTAVDLRAQSDLAAFQPLVLTIPRLRLTRYVPEGATVPQLQRYGVGRISWTALPDRPGLVGIAGHRTTYGAPFFRLGTLVAGDHIVVTYRGRRFDYVVTDRRVVRPNEVDVLRAGPGNRGIALVTCAPFYSARNRLVVLGQLRSVSAVTPTP